MTEGFGERIIREFLESSLGTFAFGQKLKAAADSAEENADGEALLDQTTGEKTQATRALLRLLRAFENQHNQLPYTWRQQYEKLVEFAASAAEAAARRGEKKKSEKGESKKKAGAKK